MTTRSSDIPRSFELGDYTRLPVIASDIIYQGSALGFSSTSGNVRPLVSGDVFAGIAIEKCDNSSGAAAAKWVQAVRKGLVLLPLTGDAAGDEGQAVYATDDDTFTLETETGTKIGRLVRVDGSYGVVELMAPDREEYLSAAGVPASVTYSVDAEAANEITATLTFKDANGNALGAGSRFQVVLCSDANGLTIEPHSATLTIASGAVGAVELKAAANALGHSSFWVVTGATGIAEVSITQTSGADTFYLATTMPNGKLSVSSAITFAA